MYLLGFSLNMLSLLGMVLAIGLVVDDAIVVVENVERQLEAGLKPLAAARKAMTEVTGPIIATTAVLMAVFIPVAFIPGVAGRLYNQFALTVAISVGISAFNSLTLSPALSAAFLRHRGEPTFPAVPLVQHRLRLAVARLCRQRPHADPLALGDARRCSSSALGAHLLRLAAHPLDLPAGRGPGLFLRRHPAARRRLAASAPTRWRSRCATSCSDTPGVEIVGSISGFNFLTNAAQSNSGGRVRHPEAMGRARPGRRARPSIVDDGAAEAAAASPTPSC